MGTAELIYFGFRVGISLKDWEYMTIGMIMDVINVHLNYVEKIKDRMQNEDIARQATQEDWDSLT